MTGPVETSDPLFPETTRPSAKSGCAAFNRPVSLNRSNHRIVASIVACISLGDKSRSQFVPRKNKMCSDVRARVFIVGAIVEWVRGYDDPQGFRRTVFREISLGTPRILEGFRALHSFFSKKFRIPCLKSLIPFVAFTKRTKPTPAMPKYIDGFVLPIPTDKIEVYREMSEKASAIWKEHGALEYIEAVGDDLEVKDQVPFTKLAGAATNECVVFAYIVYESREHRDSVNEKVMADPRVHEMCGSDQTPFDCKRMAYGGFRAIVEA